MGRQRKYYLGRPKNIEITRYKGTTYFRYKFPDGTRRVISTDRDEAFEAARALNQRFEKQRADDIAEQVLKPRPRRATPKNPKFENVIEAFNVRVLQKRRLADQTRANYRGMLDGYVERWPDRTIQEFEVHDLSNLLNECTPNTYPKHRKMLIDVFQYATSQGYRTDNPGLLTMPSVEAPEKVRQRHTTEGYRAIYEAAPGWLKNAMGLALYSLQRREDIVLLHRDAVRGNFLRILQLKTRNYSNPVYIDIDMGEGLAEVVADCFESMKEIPCPYLLHRRPKRTPKREKQRNQKTKPHPMALAPDYLSQAFSRVRDTVGAYDHLPKLARPTVHELRALGIKLYEDAGYSDEYISALSGHGDGRMLEHYKRDHHDPVPRLVSAGMGKSVVKL